MHQYYYILILLITTSPMLETKDGIYLETTATITNIEFKRYGARSIAIASVDYTTQKGEQFSSRVNLPHIPYIAPIHRKGQQIKVQYLNEAPLMLKTKSTLFVEAYGLYILIFVGVVISGWRLVKYFGR